MTLEQINKKLTKIKTESGIIRFSKNLGIVFTTSTIVNTLHTINEITLDKLFSNPIGPAYVGIKGLILTCFVWHTLSMSTKLQKLQEEQTNLKIEKAIRLKLHR